jgi:arsenate reductase (thioredoxin)
MVVNMKKVLFVCVHNAARSQMAEAFLNRLGEGLFTGESAGLEPGVLNPDVVEVMREVGYDISQNKTKSVFEFYREGKRYHYVVKVCDQINGQKCPIFPSTIKVLDWNHEDPAEFKGEREQRLSQARELRDSILKNVNHMIERERILNVDYKFLELNPLDLITNNQELYLDIEHVLLSANREAYGVTNSLFDNPRFQLESVTSSSVTNWLLVTFGKSILKQYALSHFSEAHYMGLLNNVVDSMKFNMHDIALNFTQSLHEYLNKFGLNINTQYRSYRDKENLNLIDWFEFSVKSISDRKPLILVNHSESYLVYGVDSSNNVLFVLIDGLKAKINLEEWINHTNQACLVRINIE